MFVLKAGIKSLHPLRKGSRGSYGPIKFFIYFFMWVNVFKNGPSSKRIVPISKIFIQKVFG